MSAPKRTRRQYRIGKRRLPSVTTILGMADKPALLPWAAGCGARAYARELAAGYSHDVALERVRSSWTKERDEAIDVGTKAHSMLEAWARDEDVVADLDDELDATAHALYRRGVEHLGATGSTVIASEVALRGERDGMAFGGTFDLAIERDGCIWLCDWKTGKRVYGDSVVPQLAAYRELWRWVDRDFADTANEESIHHLRNWSGKIAGALVLHLPVGGEVTEHAVWPQQLDQGWAYFEACYQLWKLKPGLTLASDDVKTTNDKDSTDE